jgi:hypothetical protein
VAAAATAAAALLAALWLRTPRELYLAAVLAATGVGALAAWRVGTRWARGAAGAFALAAAAFVISGAAAQRMLRQLATAGAAEATHADAAAAALTRAAAAAAADTRTLAGAALAAGAGAGDPFGALRRALPERGADDPERAVALFRRDTLVAWAGEWRVRPQALVPTAGVGLGRNPFYLVVHGHAADGPWRAVAATLLHADPPGDTIAAAVDRRVARAHGVREFAYATGPSAGPPAARAAGPAGDSLRGLAAALRVRAIVPGPAEARQRTIDEGRRQAAPAILLMALVWVAAVWRRLPGRGREGRRSPLARRLWSLLVPAAVLAVAPLNVLSNASRAFDPTVYYSAVGGPFTSSVGALTLTGLLVPSGCSRLCARARASRRGPPGSPWWRWSRPARRTCCASCRAASRRPRAARRCGCGWRGRWRCSSWPRRCSSSRRSPRAPR